MHIVGTVCLQTKEYWPSAYLSEGPLINSEESRPRTHFTEREVRKGFENIESQHAKHLPSACGNNTEAKATSMLRFENFVNQQKFLVVPLLSKPFLSFDDHHKSNKAFFRTTTLDSVKTKLFRISAIEDNDIWERGSICGTATNDQQPSIIDTSPAATTGCALFSKHNWKVQPGLVRCRCLRSERWVRCWHACS